MIRKYIHVLDNFIMGFTKMLESTIAQEDAER
jgi:hypothetical protein